MVFLTGMTLCGIAGALIELAVGQRLSFAPPFFSDGWPVLTLLSVVAAGPLMLINDSLDALRAGRIAPAGMAGALFIAAIWISSIGLVSMEGAKALI